MLYVIMGPPAGGKSTYVAGQAVHGDVVIDYDLICAALTPGVVERQDWPAPVRTVAHAARFAAIDKALRLSPGVDVYLIHGRPDPEAMALYRRRNAILVTCDPGPEVVAARLAECRPAAMAVVADMWYADGVADAEPTWEPASW